MPESINKILELISSLVQAGNYIGVILFILVLIAFKFNSIVAFIESRKKVKITRFTDTLGCEYLSELSKKHIQDELASEYYFIATGIRVNKMFRESLIETYYKTQNKLNFDVYKRAISYLSNDNDQMIVKINWIDYLKFWLNVFISLILVLLGAFFLNLSFSPKLENIYDILTLLGFSAFFYLFALFTISQNSSFLAAKRIKNVFNQLKLDQEQKLTKK